MLWTELSGQLPAMAVLYQELLIPNLFKHAI